MSKLPSLFSYSSLSEEEELRCAGGCALEQVAQSGCGISPTGGVLGLSGCNPVR